MAIYENRWILALVVFVCFPCVQAKEFYDALAEKEVSDIKKTFWKRSVFRLVNFCEKVIGMRPPNHLLSKVTLEGVVIRQ